jgi:hypothetical protein
LKLDTSLDTRTSRFGVLKGFNAARDKESGSSIPFQSISFNTFFVVATTPRRRQSASFSLISGSVAVLYLSFSGFSISLSGDELIVDPSDELTRCAFALMLEEVSPSRNVIVCLFSIGRAISAQAM